MSGGSPFLHRYTVKGKTLFFHSLTLGLFKSPDHAPSRQEEADILIRLREKVKEDSGIIMGTLFLTTRCPRDCSYCFLQGIPRGDMTTDEIDSVIDLLAEDQADLLLYGGEPLLRPDLVQHTLNRISNRGGKVNLSIATGGHPLDHDLARSLADLNTFAIVSIDGPPSVQNSVRGYTGEDSFKSAERTFHALRDAGCRVGISVTLTRWNVHRMPEDFKWLMDRFQPDDMGLNPWLHPLQGGVPCPGQVSAEEAFEAVTVCMEHAISAGMYIEQLARRVRPFCNRTPRLKDCASAGGRLVAVPGGIAGGCDCMTVCGDHGVPVGDTKKISEILSSLRTLSPVNSRSCLSCPVLGLCGGGCRYDGFHSSGKLDGYREERCGYERRFLQWMIERTMEHGRESLIPSGGFSEEAMPMPVGTLIGEGLVRE